MTVLKNRIHLSMIETNKPKGELLYNINKLKCINLTKHELVEIK